MQQVANLEVRAEGIYIVINNPNGETIPRLDVVQAIEACAVRDVNFDALNRALNSKEPRLEVLITRNTKIRAKNEDVKIDISADRLRASLRLIPPGFAGSLLTLDDVLARIRAMGIQLFERERVEKALAERNYNESYDFAFGRSPEAGTPGWLEYTFDTSRESMKPKELEDGSVNFHNLAIFKPAELGQELVIAHPPVSGKDGANVFGNAIPAKPVKLTPPIRHGKGTELFGDNEDRLRATTSGRIIYEGGKVSVSSELELAEVGPQTGDIDYKGTVIVRGNVKSGYSITATDDIVVYGIVEGATLISEGSVQVIAGIQGANKAVIRAGRDVFMKFAENCKEISGENIYCSCIMHSQASAKQKIVLNGKTCVLVGGVYSAGDSIESDVIGSSMATSTELFVGCDPDILERYQVVVKSMNELKAELKSLDYALEPLKAANAEGRITDIQKAMLVKTLHSKSFVRAQFKTLQKEFDEQILPQLSGGRGEIIARIKILPGTDVIIGNAMMYIRDELAGCVLKNDGERIRAFKFVSKDLI